MKNQNIYLVIVLDCTRICGCRDWAYTYDAWGNFTQTQGPDSTAFERYVADHNPFRYRGYIYDGALQAYYLQSRFYDPSTGRFLNADTYVNANGDLIGFNMYAYCSNNPVMYVDPTGEFLISALIIGAAAGAIISGAVSAGSQYIETGEVNGWTVLLNAATGAISGAIASTGIGLGASVAINAGLSAVNYVGEQHIQGEDATVVGVISSTLAGAGSGLIGGKGADAQTIKSTFTGAGIMIAREMRRQNAKYAAKQIVKYTFVRNCIKKAVAVNAGRFVLGTIANNVGGKHFNSVGENHLNNRERWDIQ